MRIQLLFVLLYAAIGLLAQPVNEIDSQGRKQGPWKKFFENSQSIFYEGQFSDDQPIGTFTYYYDTGKVKGVMRYRSDRETVFNQTYHRNGNIMAEGKYINQKKDSLWIYYNKSGVKSSVEHWDKGAKHGIEEVYYESGKLSETTEHVDGLRNGVWKQYHDNGKVKVKSEFVQDKFHGAIEYFFENGSKEVTGKYNEGVRTGTWMYFNDDGTVRYQAVYRGGKKQKERFENGTFDDYGADNIILSTTTYVNGLKEGEFTEYHDDAIFNLEQYTDPKTGESYAREVKTGNELKRSGTYVADKLHGEVKHYNKLGRNVKTENYINGELQK